jgi:hypothetical protein
MKYISPLISDARNKLGGTVFARNRAGVYTRARVSPTQPRTPSQQANRANFAALSASWKALTQTQIQGWNNAATGQLLTDTLGHSFMPTGAQLYMRCSRNLGLISLPPIGDAPAGPPPFPALGPLAAACTRFEGSLTAVTLSLPAALISAAPNMVAYATAGLSPGINFIPRHFYRNLPTPYPATAGTTPVVYGSIPAGGGADTTAPFTFVSAAPLGAGELLSITGKHFSTIAPGGTITFIICTVVGVVVTVTDSFTVSISGAPGLATWNANIDFAPRTVSAGQCLGWYTAANSGLAGVGASSPYGTYYYPNNPPPGPTAFSFTTNPCALTATVGVASTGTALNLTTAYSSIFGVPPVGDRIGVKLRIIDPNTGYASTESTAATLVTGT